MSAGATIPSWISWTLRAAWLLSLATFLFAGFHAADGDPRQWGSAFAFVFSLLFAIALTGGWASGRMINWIRAWRSRRTSGIE